MLFIWFFVWYYVRQVPCFYKIEEDGCYGVLDVAERERRKDLCRCDTGNKGNENSGGEFIEGKYTLNSLWNDSLLVKYSEFGYSNACIFTRADC